MAQDIYLKAFHNLSGFKFQSKLSTWIAKIGYLTAINHLKKQGNKTFSQYAEDLNDTQFTNENPESLIIKKDIGNYVSLLIEQLPVRYKTVLTLYHLNEFTYLEIEQITGMPEGTVKGYLHRARKLLKEKIEIYFKNDIL